MISNYEKPNAIVFWFEEEEDIITASTLNQKDDDNCKSIDDWTTGQWKGV